ncbi:MAG: hypothetical protein QXX17_05305 [Conexivisphaerales archaeon]
MEVSGCSFEDDLLYDVENHVWARLIDREVEVGVDSIVVWLTGPLRSLRLAKPGDFVQKGRILGSVESARHFDVVRSPVSGYVQQVNQHAIADPFVVNKDPYHSGWLVRIMPSAVEEIRLLKKANEAAGQFEKIISSMKIHCFKEFPEEELYEIGVECSAALVRLNDLLSKSRPGIVVHVVTDDPLAEIEMVRWSDQTGNLLIETRAEGNLRHFIVKKKE